MLKKTIVYTDYEGNERTDDFYFNLNQPELLEMNVSEKGGLEKVIEKIIATDDFKKLVEIFKEIILKAYGEKSLDGRHFVKSKELSERFSQTEAYSILFMELALNAEAASAFINGIISSKQEAK